MILDIMVTILGIFVKKGFTDTVKLQGLLSAYGCVIKTRLGLHEVIDDHAVPGGLIILELEGDHTEMYRLENELLKIDTLDVQKMRFSAES